MFYNLEWSSSVDSARFKKMLEKERVFEFLVGLNKELDEVRRCVLVKEPLPFTREVFLEVQREESRRTVMMGKTTKTIMVCQTSAPSVSTMEGLSVESEKTCKKNPGMQALTKTQISIDLSLFSKEQLANLYKLMNQSFQNPSCTLAYKGILPRALSFISFYTPWIIDSGASDHITS